MANKMEAVEGIVKIWEKEGLKIGDLMKKEKREYGCWQRLRSIWYIQKIFKCENKIVLVINMGIRVKAMYEECFEAFGVAGFGGRRGSGDRA